MERNVTMTRFSRYLALAVLACVSLARPACAEKVLKAVVHADLKILDSGWTTAYITNRYSYIVYDTLFAVNDKFEPKPQMVESWTVSDDALTYTFTLRPGLKFHDGQKVTAADCIASLKRWMQRDVMGQRLEPELRELVAVDESSFRLVLKQPYGLVLETLAKPTTAPYMMPERVAKAPLTEQITSSIGSGPFIMQRDKWQPGNKVVFVRNPEYIPRKEPPSYLSGGKVPKLDRLEWLYIPDANTTLNALITGEIDYFEAPPLDFIGILKENPDIRVLNIDHLGIQGLIRPNSLFPPFNNYKARQALLYIINQQDYMAAVAGDPDLYLKYCGAFFLCNSGNETAAGAVTKPDIAKAKALLKEAGYNGEKIVVLQPTDRQQYSAATTVLISELRAAGVNVDVQAADWSTISARRARKDPPDKGGWHLFITTHGGPDPSVPISNTWFNSGCERANPGWACDEDLQALVGKWIREPEPVQRKALIDQIQLRAYESVPYVPFGQFFQPVAFRKNVTGVVEAGQPVYWNIDKN